MLYKDIHHVYVFDSHARDDCGLPSPRGKAVLLKFTDRNHLVSYLHTIASTMGDNPVPNEIVSLKISSTELVESSDIFNIFAAQLGQDQTVTPDNPADDLTQPMEAQKDDKDKHTQKEAYEDDRCIICCELFSQSKPGEYWNQCQGCRRWCHENCADIRQASHFICDFCN